MKKRFIKRNLLRHKYKEKSKAAILNKYIKCILRKTETKLILKGSKTGKKSKISNSVQNYIFSR